MDSKELNKLKKLERVIRKIAEEEGLTTTEIIFEVASPQRILEGMAYMFPKNYSHWSFGRDYDKYRTIYEHTHQGIPYEQVWNLDPPKAFLLGKNPLALNVMVIAHVFGHVDFFLENKYTAQAREMVDTAEEAAVAAGMFHKYELRYGKNAVEKIIDAAKSIEWHRHPDPLFVEPNEDVVRENLIKRERQHFEAKKKELRSSEKISQLRKKTEKRIANIKRSTPPRKTYDLLLYIIENSQKLEDWERNVLRIVRNQARVLHGNMETKMLNEGWATYWHWRIMNRLFREGHMKDEDHIIFNRYHSNVIRAQKKGFNWYRIGSALFEDIKDRWDRGAFGPEYELLTSYRGRKEWDIKAGLGAKEVFRVRKTCTDRMAVDLYFSDDFIKDQKIYIYKEDKIKGQIVSRVVEKNPKVIRGVLLSLFTSRGIPIVTVENGNYRNKGQLYLKHRNTGFELDDMYRRLTLKRIHRLWGKKVYLETFEKNKKDGQKKKVIYTYDDQKYDKISN